MGHDQSRKKVLCDKEGATGASLGCTSFRPYLYGRKFTARTDHNSLKWLRNFRDPYGQVALWLEILAEYTFSVVHRPGLQHGNADALSRLPCKQCRLQEDVENSTSNSEQEPEVNGVTMISSTWIQSWTPKEIQSLQANDAALKQIAQWLSTKSLPAKFPQGVHSHLQTL